MDDGVLSLRKVTKSYNQRSVLADIDLEIPRGSVTGLLGKNGAGKTTLIRSALGLIKPERGEIAILGEPAWTMSDHVKERIGYVPQTPSLYAWMRVSQILEYTASFYSRWNDDLIERQRKEWDLNCSDVVGKLSVGQQQKLAILLSLGHEPDLLVFDEPVASLDPTARRQFLRVLLDIAASNQRTILFSTHITSDLERVADRVAILSRGSIIYSDGLDTLKDEVKRVHVTASQPLPGNFSLPGILRMKVDGNEALVSVLRMSPELAEETEKKWSVRIDVQDLNLEDIFLEMVG